jgi:hypothetical protein
VSSEVVHHCQNLTEQYDTLGFTPHTIPIEHSDVHYASVILTVSIIMEKDLQNDRQYSLLPHDAITHTQDTHPLQPTAKALNPVKKTLVNNFGKH